MFTTLVFFLFFVIESLIHLLIYNLNLSISLNLSMSLQIQLISNSSFSTQRKTFCFTHTLIRTEISNSIEGIVERFLGRRHFPEISINSDFAKNAVQGSLYFAKSPRSLFFPPPQSYVYRSIFRSKCGERA